MEDILASIKRIIADDGAAAAGPTLRQRPPRGARPVAVSEPETAPEVLELTEAVEPAVASAPPPPEPAPPAAVAASMLVSDDTASASRHSLASLSSLVVKPAASDNTLDGLVREMLRPMLKDWLDQRLPELVEGLVQREIARITGTGL